MSNQNNEIPNGFKKTEIGIIPEDWEVVKLGDVANYINGYAFKPSDWKKTGLPIIRIQNLTGSTNEINYYDGELDSKYKVKKGDLLISWSASLGVFKWQGEDAWLNQHIFKVDNISPNTWKDFLYYVVMTQIESMKTRTHGSTMHHITKKEFLAVKIPLPPLPEQKKIAHVLSTIQEAKEKTEAVIKASKELKKSLMKYLFTYGPVPFNEAENVKLKETEIGLIPEDWEVVKLGDVLLRTQYGLSKRASDSGKYPMIRMNNMINGRIDVSDLKYIDLDEEEYQKFKVNKGDILFNRTNSIELVGKTSLFDLDLDCVFASYIIRLSLDTQRLMPEFLNYYMNIDATQKNLKKLASRGVSQSNISATKLKTFKVPLPPLHIQQKIASILSAVDEKIEKEENKKRALEELFKSMLHNLMTGKIRVKDLDIEVEEDNDVSVSEDEIKDNLDTISQFLPEGKKLSLEEILELVKGIQDLWRKEINKESIEKGRRWLSLAKEDLNSSKSLYEKGEFRNSMMLLQQSVEKLVKGWCRALNLATEDVLRSKVGHKTPFTFIEIYNQKWATSLTSFFKNIYPQIESNIHPFEKMINKKQRKIASLSEKDIDILLGTIDKLEKRLTEEYEEKKPLINNLIDNLAKTSSRDKEIQKKIMNLKKKLDIRTLIAFINTYILSSITYPHIHSRYPDDKVEITIYNKDLGIVKKAPEIFRVVEKTIEQINMYLDEIDVRK